MLARISPLSNGYNLSRKLYPLWSHRCGHMSAVDFASPVVVREDELPRACVEVHVRGDGNGAPAELVLAVRYQRLQGVKTQPNDGWMAIIKDQKT